MNRFNVLLILLLCASVPACGGDSGGSANPIVPTVPVNVSSIAISLGQPAIAPGSSTVATAVLRDATGSTLSGRQVSWSSSASTIASIDGSGNISGIAPGTTVITATSEGKSGSASLTVTQVPVATVTLNPAAGYLYVGEQGAFEVTLKDANGNVLSGRTIAWSSSTNTVATVGTAGLVTAVAPGTTTITAICEGKTTAAVVTILKAPEAVATVVLQPINGTLYVGEAGYFTVTLKDANGNTLLDRDITWASSAPNVATAATDGLISGFAPGVAIITATSEGKRATASVTVSTRPTAATPVATVTITPGTSSLYVGDASFLTATLSDATGNTLSSRVITWTSSAPSIVSVVSGGGILALATGTATITATSEGRSALATVIVANRPAPSGNLCTQIAGSRIVASDNTFIGSLTNKYNNESVLNTYGDYGSKYSAKSIYNTYGDYGSKYSNKSAYSPYTSTPPKIFLANGTFLWLTVNTTIAANSSVHPDFLKTCTNFP